MHPKPRETQIASFYVVPLFLDPIAYGILRFCNLVGGGGGGWAIYQKEKLMKFATNNIADSTSKHAELYAVDFSTFRNMTSQSYPRTEGNE